jgi:superfamily II DNA or RNA helicase
MSLPPAIPTLVLQRSLVIAGLPGPLANELTARLRFANPRWLENQRMGRWNRCVPRELRFYRKLSGGRLAVPRGCVRMLIDLLTAHDLDYRLQDERRVLPEVDFSFQGRLKPFQHEALQAMAGKEFGTLSAPTGSGKTVIALALIAARRQPALVIVHTRELADQWRQRIEQFLGLPPDEIGQIGAGSQCIGARVTVALVQSLYGRAESIAPRIGFLVADECHRCPSRTFTEAVTAFDCRYMLGLSATPYRRDNLSRLIFWYLGAMHHRVDAGRLMQAGDVVAADVVLRETRFTTCHDPIGEYSQMLSELTADAGRNRMVVDDIVAETRRQRGVCLVLSDRKSHCEMLVAMLRVGEKLRVERLTGDLALSVRREVLERLAQGELQVLVATGQLIGEGFDCPQLTSLFLATPIRFSGRLLQYLGRVLRPAPGKKSARVYDYVDARVDVLLAAAQARQRVYQRWRARAVPSKNAAVTTG